MTNRKLTVGAKHSRSDSARTLSRISPATIPQEKPAPATRWNKRSTTIVIDKKLAAKARRRFAPGAFSAFVERKLQAEFDPARWVPPPRPAEEMEFARQFYAACEKSGEDPAEVLANALRMLADRAGKKGGAR